MVSTLLKDGTVIAFDDATQSINVLHEASVLIVDDRITAIVKRGERLSIPDDAEILDVRGKIVSPGFVNTHVHSWQTVYRSMGPNTNLCQYFGWVSHMSDTVTAAFTPDDVYISSLEGYLEGLNAGVTSYVEHAHNNWTRAVAERGFDAAADSGARVWWCYDLLSRPNHSVDEQKDMLKRFAARDVPAFVALGLSLDGLARSNLDDLAAQLETMSSELNLQALTVHHLGSPWPGDTTSPASLCKHSLQKTGLPIIFSHAPFLTDQDMQALREHDLFISITPESECHFGHGQKTGRLISDQASIGVDTTWTFSSDILSQARLWLQLLRYTNYTKTLEGGLLPRENPMTVEQGFLLATRQGGRALRRNDIGVLQVGAKADIVVFDGSSPNMLGWSDAVAAVLLHANPGDIEHVLVDGQFRKRDFKLIDTKLSWAEVRERFVEAAKRIQPQFAVPPPLPERLWGVGEMGNVEKASTIRHV